MNDRKIIELFQQRSEAAIDAVSERYGAMCRGIAWNLLHSQEDAEECVNDTWHALWNAIPPQNPEKLGTYAARITRNLAMKRLTAQNAEKRRAVTVPYEELSDCIAADGTLEAMIDAMELSRLLDAFLDTLDRDSRDLFLRRYWFSDTIEEIARGFGMSQTRVTTRLYRIRNQLKDYLAKEADIYVK